MRQSVSPPSHVGLLMFLLLILALASLLGAVGCGGSPSAGGGGGGAGGGGHNVPPCTFTTPNAGGTTSGAGLNTQISDLYFGMHLNSTNAPWPSLSFGSQRLWDSGVAWSQIESSSGAYDWTLMDTWLSDAHTHGADVLYNLARTPTWASSGPTDSSCIDSSRNGPGQCHPPVDLNSDGTGTNAIWISWVTNVAQHSQATKAAGGTGISYYEIWNEWNASVFWVGTTEQLVRMEQDARCIVEGPPAGMRCNANSLFPSGTKLDASAKIVSPSPVGAHPRLTAVADSLTSYFQTQVDGHAGGSFSDVIGFHGYVGTGSATNGIAVPCPTPEDVNTVIANMNNNPTVSAGMAGKPLFNTEGGWSKADDEGFIDEDRQAAFLPRYLLLQESANVGRVYWYAWDSKKLASLYNDVTKTTTKAATAYAEVNKWSVGATLSAPCTAVGTVWTCGFKRANGYLGLAVWDAGKDCTSSSCPTSSFTIPGGAAYTEYRDVAGNVTSLVGGAVQIGAKPILLETGPLP